jgi:archaellum component FlaC
MPQNKKPSASMGQPHTVVDAKSFLRRGESAVPTVRNPGALGVAKRSTAKEKPSVPRRDEKPVMGLVSQKNYITANAVDNILAVPKRPVSKEVNYLQKQDYGQVPAYLDRVKTQIQEEYRMIEEMTQSNQPQNEDDIEMLTEAEREKLLEGLKTNWATVNKEYQTLSFTLDTPAKKKRKEEYEQQLEQIEQDIKKLSKKFVFVHTNGMFR